MPYDKFGHERYFKVVYVTFFCSPLKVKMTLKTYNTDILVRSGIRENIISFLSSDGTIVTICIKIVSAAIRPHVIFVFPHNESLYLIF